jgi:hypothetical protein
MMRIAAFISVFSMWVIAGYLTFNFINFIAVGGRVEELFIFAVVFSVILGGIISFAIALCAPKLNNINSVRIVEREDNKGDVTYSIREYCGYLGIITSWEDYEGGGNKRLNFTDIDKAKHTLNRIREKKTKKHNNKTVRTRELNL